MAAVPGFSEEEAASLVDGFQSDKYLMAALLAECEEGTSVRGFGALAAPDAPPEERELATAASEIMYKYYCPQAPSS